MQTVLYWCQQRRPELTSQEKANEKFMKAFSVVWLSVKWRDLNMLWRIVRGNEIWSIWIYKSVTCKTEIDSLRGKLPIGFPYQFMKSWLSRTDSLPIKERNLGSTGMNLVMKIHLTGWLDTEAWRSLLQNNVIFSCSIPSLVIKVRRTKPKFILLSWNT